MKKIKYIIQILMMIVFFGCTEEDLVKSNKGDICVTAGFANTRTTYTEDNGTVHVTWNAEDKIGLFTDEQTNLQYIALQEGSSTKFSPFEEWNKLNATEGQKVYAYYPYSYTITNKKTVELPVIDKQYYKENASEYDFIYATNNIANNELFLQFKHLFAFLKIKISLSLLQKNNDIYDINITSSEAISLNYPAYFDLAKEEIISKKSNYINYFIPDNENLKDKEYITCYIAILPQSQDAEITIYNTTFEKLLLEKSAPSGGFKAGNVYSLYFDKDEIAAVKERERDALIAFYHATNGDNWTRNDNWCSDKPVSEWYGINCLGDFVTDITLTNNNLNGILPDEIGELTNLQSLFLPAYGGDLTPNNIRGKIPNSIGNLKKLRNLNLLQNMITGTLPENMKYLSKIESLELAGRIDFNTGAFLPYDYISGEIPEWIGDLTNLRNIDLSNNHLSGSIPNSISKLTNLVSLQLNANQLSGVIPNELYKLEKLEHLMLTGNKLSGSLPSDFSKLLDIESLKTAYIGANCLTGKIPDEIVQHTRFPDFAGMLLDGQKDGYGFDMSTLKVPAVKRTYPLLDQNGFINLGEEYAKKDYTLLFRWAEWCPLTKQIMPTIIDLAKRYKNASFQIIGAYGGGKPSERESFMQQYEIKGWKHFKEKEKDDVFQLGIDHPIWHTWMGYAVPFIEVVDRSGNIVFLDDTEGFYSQLPAAHKRDEIADFLRSVLGEGEKPYESTDYSKDGNVTLLQKATEGKGIDIVLMGDAYSDRLIADGTYKASMQKATDYLFTEEPFKSFRNLFNVYMVDVVSKNEVYGGETALSTYFGDGTLVGGNDNKCFEYAQKAISDERINEALIVVMINSPRYAGTCWMYNVSSTTNDYGSGPSVAYFPIGTDEETFEQLLHHEACGHGFSKLADEYAYQNYGAIPANEIQDYQSAGRDYGWYKNVDFTSDPTQVKWSKYLSDSRYSNDGLGVFEGACTYWTGAYRPTDVSIMRYNTDGFNAPSREAIYYRIHKLAYGTPWAFNYEDFVTYDAINRKASTRSTTWNSAAVKRFRENHCPPVVIRKNWRNAK